MDTYHKKLYIILIIYDGLGNLGFLLFITRLWMTREVRINVQPNLIISQIFSTLITIFGITLLILNTIRKYHPKFNIVYFKIGLFFVTFTLPLIMFHIKKANDTLNTLFICSIFVPFILFIGILLEGVFREALGTFEIASTTNIISHYKERLNDSKTEILVNDKSYLVV